MNNTNPIPEILELLPLTESVLDPKLLDTLIDIVRKKTKLVVSNTYIILLLSHLTDEGYVTLTEVNCVSAVGKLYFIKKEI